MTAFAILPNGEGSTKLFASSGAGVFLSNDNGTTWTGVNSGITNPDVLSLAVLGTNLFAGTNGDGVYLSTNNGATWTGINSGLTKPFYST